MKILNFGILAAILLVVLNCSESSPKKVKFVPEKPKENVSTEAGLTKDAFRPRLDILFVIDDSGSMSTHQQNLSKNIQKFADAIVRFRFLDFHIGVITSSTTTGFGGSAPCCGKLIGKKFKYVDRNTPNGIEVLSQNLLVGTNGDATEKFFDPTVLALTEPMLSGYNKGFYRPEAKLALIFITDTEDQSYNYQVAQDFYDFVVQLKGTPDKVFTAAAWISDANASVCSGESDIGYSNELADFLKMTFAYEFSLCDDFGVNLAEVGKLIANQSKLLYLQKIPKEGSIKISLAGIDLPKDAKKGWSYIPELNAIEFGNDIEWDLYPYDAYPQIDYEVLPL